MSLPIGTSLPSFDGEIEWINGAPQHNSFIGNPILIQFWASSCPVCKMNMPNLFQLISKFSDNGLKLISIHMPRGPFDLDIEQVKIISNNIGIDWPCGIDNKHVLGQRFQTGNVWPYYFLFDNESRLRTRAAGNLGLKMIENSLIRLLKISIS